MWSRKRRARNLVSSLKKREPEKTSWIRENYRNSNNMGYFMSRWFFKIGWLHNCFYPCTSFVNLLIIGITKALTSTFFSFISSFFLLVVLFSLKVLYTLNNFQMYITTNTLICIIRKKKTVNRIQKTFVLTCKIQGCWPGSLIYWKHSLQVRN